LRVAVRLLDMSLAPTLCTDHPIRAGESKDHK
jgi:hypothetical protein